jgi:hypothetical protein
MPLDELSERLLGSFCREAAQQCGIVDHVLYTRTTLNPKPDNNPAVTLACECWSNSATPTSAPTRPAVIA